MLTFILGIAALILGYVFYGRFLARLFGAKKNNPTPALRLADGVDYIALPTWKVYLIQFLNIAGTGPIFGAIMGIFFGPAAYLWIVLGCIFIGATHDYLSGMISLRKDGASLPEIIGDELGSGMRNIMRFISFVLLILVGAVFVLTPAGLLGSMTEGGFGLSMANWTTIWIVAIFIYYIAATLLPIDTLIGRFYPIFGLALLIMAVGVGYGVLTQDGWLPEITDAPFVSHHPGGFPLLPFLCITIACGAISGFHATQSPLMARCIKNEKYGRFIFYGAMITEGVVAMIWAAAAIKYTTAVTGTTGEAAYTALHDTVKGNPAVLVNMICDTWMGRIGGILAVLGVVAAPITSGDTACRSARLIAADMLHFEQHTLWHRLVLALPIFVLAGLLMCIHFDVLWRYFAWTNQTLGAITLWCITVWLTRNKKLYIVTLLPALFMTFVCSCYILMAPEGFQLDQLPSYCIGGAFTLCCLVLFFVKRKSLAKKSRTSRK